MTSKRKMDSKALKLLTALGALLSAILLLKDLIQPQYFYPIITLIVIMMFSLTILIVVPYFSALINKVLRIYKHNRVAKKNFPRLLDFVRQLCDFLDMENIENISNILVNLQDTQDFQNVEMRMPNYLYKMAVDTLGIINSVSQGKKEFVKVANIVDDIIILYNEDYIRKSVNLIANIGVDKVPFHIRQIYNSRRDEYIIFLNNFSEFLESMNHSFQEEIFEPRYEYPERF